MDNVLDSALISRSINYHGQQLKKAWETERGEGDLERLNVENLDFAVFQERQKSLGFQDRSKRFKLHQFIAKNANVLFDEVLNIRVPTNKVQQSVEAELSAVLPPFDVFNPDMDKKERVEHFLDCLKPGDLIVGSLTSKVSSGYFMKIAYSEGDSVRIVADLGLKAIIPSANMIQAIDKKNNTRSFLLNDMVCCEVLEVIPNSEKIYGGMKGDCCSPSLRQRLGLLHSEDLSPVYSYVV